MVELFHTPGNHSPSPVRLGLAEMMKQWVVAAAAAAAVGQAFVASVAEQANSANTTNSPVSTTLRIGHSPLVTQLRHSCNNTDKFCSLQYRTHVCMELKPKMGEHRYSPLKGLG